MNGLLTRLLFIPTMGVITAASTTPLLMDRPGVLQYTSEAEFYAATAITKSAYEAAWPGLISLVLSWALFAYLGYRADDRWHLTDRADQAITAFKASPPRQQIPGGPCNT